MLRFVLNIGWIFVVALLASASGVSFADDLSVKFLGLQGKKANVSINRRSVMLLPRQTSKHGVTLLTASRSHAVFAINGHNYLYKKGKSRGARLSKLVKLSNGANGMYRATTDINGRSVAVIVDTGATFVSISRERARKMGLRYRKDKPIQLQTASTVETAYLTTLDSVRLGGIVRFDVPAVVTKSKHPSVVLLGMSFLSGLNISQANGIMTISQ